MSDHGTRNVALVDGWVISTKCYYTCSSLSLIASSSFLIRSSSSLCNLSSSSFCFFSISLMAATYININYRDEHHDIDHIFAICTCYRISFSK